MAALDPLPPLLQATSGAIGSAVGNAIVFPLDLATTRLQHTPRRGVKKLSLLRTLVALTRRKGIIGLYDGLPADTLSTILSSFLYFLFYTSASKGAARYHRSASSASTSNPAGLGRSSAKPSTPRPLRAWEELLIGLLAGIASKGVTLPLSAVSVRQRMGDEEGAELGFFDTIKAMHREGGFCGLFAALPPSVPLALLPSLTLYIHSALLRLLIPARHRAHPPAHVTFCIGALSNALATLPLYPLVLIKAFSQSGSSRRSKGAGAASVRSIWQTEGVFGFYKGLEGQLVKGLLSQGVMMLVKQRTEELTVRAWRHI